MLTKYQIICCAGCLLAVASSPSVAEINKREGVDPGAQAKINQAQAQAWSKKGQAEGQFGSSGGECGSVQIGNVQTRPGQRAPRDVITVIKGDVVNVAKGCKK